MASLTVSRIFKLPSHLIKGNISVPNTRISRGGCLEVMCLHLKFTTNLTETLWNTCERSFSEMKHQFILLMKDSIN